MRFAAQLLFRYGVDGRAAARPLCEKRIVVVRARDADGALRQAETYGKRAQYSYRNVEGGRFRVRYLGVVDLIELLPGSDACEVYYSMVRTSRPERQLRRKAELSVFRDGPKTLASSWWAVPEWLVHPTRAPRGSNRKQRKRPK